MLQLFTDAWAAHAGELKEYLQARAVDSERPHWTYAGLLNVTLKQLFPVGVYNLPDGNHVTDVTFGDYQGTRVLVVGSGEYQPSTHWVTSVYYGSCSACDALQAAQDIEDREEWVQAHMRLALTMIQNMKEV